MSLILPELSNINIANKEYLMVNMCAMHKCDNGDHTYTDVPEETDYWTVFVMKYHEDTGIVDDIDRFEWDFLDQDDAWQWGEQVAKNLNTELEEY